MRRNQRIPLTRYADFYGIATLLEALYHAHRETHAVYATGMGYCSFDGALSVYKADPSLLCVEVRNAA